VLSVPGFIVRERNGDRYLTLAGAAGLLIPVRDLQGKIIGLKIRRDEATDAGGRYSFFSSTRYGGLGPGAPVHVPFGVNAPAQIVRLTEGELKADVAFSLSRLPTISAPGVSSWRQCLPVLKTLGSKTVRLAFDRDARDKSPVARALGTLAQSLVAEGYGIQLECWPDQHKGIDEALAADALIEILCGDAARQAIGDIVAEGTAGDSPQEESVLDRLTEVLASGAESLFRNGELLRALAQIAEDDPAEFAVCRARIKGARIGLRDLDKVLSPLRHTIRRERPVLDVAGSYRIVAGRIVREVLTRDGAVEVPLATWAARIVAEVVCDDGAERSVIFSVEGNLVDGTPLPCIDIPADEWPYMRWPVEKWGARAVVLAGAGTADHLRCALQFLSGDVPRRTVYAHTGWREIDGRQCYLHAAGAIGAEGPVEGIAVALPSALSRFELRMPQDRNRLRQAVAASLRLLELGPPHLLFPLLATVYRAVLGYCDFAVHACGPTGTFKSETAALCEQHFGAGLDARHLPANWSSTANALETLAFSGKDALLVVDDFAPAGSTGDAQRLHKEADRLLRAQGNAAGRGRLAPDGTLRPVKPPRGLILSTGEDVPPGQSLRARMFVVEFSHGDIDVRRLSACQHDAADGLYVESLASYVRWLAPRYGSIRDGLRAEVAELRDMALAGVAHRRTPEIISNLYVGLRHFLSFAVETGAMTDDERALLLTRAWEALGNAATAQAEHVQAADPVAKFFRLLSAALASGRAHVATPTGGAPDNGTAWGWRERMEGRVEFQGRRIGWIDDGDLYLEPEASYAEAQELARVQGESLPVSTSTLRRRLKDCGLLVSTEPGKLLTRRTLDGERRFVIHLSSAVLSAHGQGESGEPGQAADKCSGSCPYSSPDSVSPETESGEQPGEKRPEESVAAPVPHIPPIANSTGVAPARNISTVVRCRYPNHRRRWRSIHNVVNCGICTPPVGAEVVAEWLDGAPEGTG
jgi:hypothetical protein